MDEPVPPDQPAIAVAATGGAAQRDATAGAVPQGRHQEEIYMLSDYGYEASRNRPPRQHAHRRGRVDPQPPRPRVRRRNELNCPNQEARHSCLAEKDRQECLSSWTRLVNLFCYDALVGWRWPRCAGWFSQVQQLGVQAKFALRAASALISNRMRSSSA